MLLCDDSGGFLFFCLEASGTALVGVDVRDVFVEDGNGEVDAGSQGGFAHRFFAAQGPAEGAVPSTVVGEGDVVAAEGCDDDRVEEGVQFSGVGVFAGGGDGEVFA